MRIAMVCLGNICRSPMAASVAASMIAEAGIAGKVSVESFGTAGYHIGERADRRALAALKRRGYDAGDHRARKLAVEDLEKLDLVLCADHANLRDVRRLAPDRLVTVGLLRSFDPASMDGDDEVPDPWSGGPSDFDHALDLIESACRGLVDSLRQDRC